MNTAWLSPGDGFLALDRDGDGKISGIGELFGSASRNGFDELSELDGNGDGVIDSQDAAYARLLVWQDGDGVKAGRYVRPCIGRALR